jgi:hypothetical protein
MPMHSNSHKYGIPRDHISWQHQVQQFQLIDHHNSLPVREENNEEFCMWRSHLKQLLPIYQI